MKYLSKLLSMFLVGAMLYSTGCTDHAADIKDINNRLDELVQNEIDPLKADLDKTKTELQAAIADVNEAIEDHAEDLAALESAVADAEEAIEGLEAADGELLTKINAANAAISEANEKIQALENVDKEQKQAIDALTSSVNTLSGDVNSLKEFAMQMTAWVANAESAIATLQEKVAILEESVEDLEESVKDLEETKLDVTTFEEYKTEAAAKFQALADADEALAKADEVLEGKIADHVAAVNTEFEKAYAEIAKNTTEINKLAADLLAKYNELKAKDEALEEADKAIKEDIAKLDEAIQKVEGDLAAYKTEVNQRLLNAEGSIGQLQVDVQGLNDKLDEFKAAYDAHIAAYEEFVKNTNAALEALGLSVENIINRIQSIVYRPNYADGKLSIDYATFGKNTIVEGRSTAEYNVYPAEGAYAIAKAFAEGKAIVDFDLSDELKTRADAPKFTVVDVQNTKTGRIAVTFVTRGLSDKFYQRAADAENYAISLFVDLTDVEAAADANLSTCFTNIIGGEHSPITMDIVYNDEVVTGNNEVYVEDLVYTQWNVNHPDFVSLPGYFLQYNFKDETYTAAELVEFGYEEVKPIYAGTEVVCDNVEVTNVPNTETGYNEQHLDITALDLSLIGKEFNLVYTYSYSGAIGEESVSAGATLAVVKEQATITIAPEYTIHWSYLVDAVVDAERLKNADAAAMNLPPYERTTHPLSFDYANVTREKLPEDTTIAGVLANEPAVITVNDEVVKADDDLKIKLYADDEAQKVSVEFSGFEWDKTYNVVVKYELANVDVTVNFTVVTVDRYRKPILVDLGTLAKVYKSNFVFENAEVDPMASFIDQTIKSYPKNFDGISVDEYLTDVFVTKAYYNLVNTVNSVAATEGTMLDIVEGKNVNIKYNYADDDITVKDGLVVRDLAYSKKITLWYGQEVEFIKNVTFNAPTYWFVKVPNYVYDINGGFVSDVQPYYYPNRDYETSLEVFDVNKVDLNAAFDLIDAKFTLMSVPVETKDKKVRGQVVADNGDVLKPVFSLDNDVKDVYKPATGKGILMYDNYISYYGTDSYVGVDATLYLVNNNNSKMVIVTNFDENVELPNNVDDYSTYRVKQYNPLLSGTAVSHEPEYVYEQHDYIFDLTEYFSLKDRRTRELINRENRIDEDGSLLKENFLVYGDGTNGFAKNLYAGYVYGYKSIDEQGVPYGDIHPVDIKFAFKGNDALQLESKGLLTLDPDAATVKFRYNSQVDLQRPIVIDVVMSVTTAWSESETTTNQIVIKNGFLVDEE